MKCIKKATALLMSTIMAISSISSNVWADESMSIDNVHLEHTDYDCGIDSVATDESINMFNTYLASLEDDVANAILNDQELVRYMQTEAYWTNDTNGIDHDIAVRSVTLPLSNYPAGSYFTYNGQGCTCHDDCTYAVPSGYSPTDRCYIAATNTSGNCKRYNGSIQCAGFAYYVYKQYTGTQCSSSNQVPGLTLINEYTLKTFFSNMTVGSHVRGTLSSGINHSIIVTGVTESGISYYQANISGDCGVSTNSKTWAQLKNWYSGISVAWVA